MGRYRSWWMNGYLRGDGRLATTEKLYAVFPLYIYIKLRACYSNSWRKLSNVPSFFHFNRVVRAAYFLSSTFQAPPTANPSPFRAAPPTTTYNVLIQTTIEDP